MANPTNADIADLLDRIADLLELQNDNLFRVRAYREGAQSIRTHKPAVAKLIHADTFDAVKDIPNIGEGIAAIIGEYVSSGESSLLNELETKAAPEAAFAALPGIGVGLAQRIVEQLHIRTLQELEEAAHDGRLESVDGIGKKRVRGIMASLETQLKRTRRSSSGAASTGKKASRKATPVPPVALLLEVDAEYRRRAEADDLYRIAPKRFNPDNAAWLPVMHVTRDGWRFDVMFSNTAQAHKLGKTNDWVVMYFERDGVEGQHTVVTETKGSKRGQRVVRGRE